ARGAEEEAHHEAQRRVADSELLGEEREQRRERELQEVTDAVDRSHQRDDARVASQTGPFVEHDGYRTLHGRCPESCSTTSRSPCRAWPTRRPRWSAGSEAYPRTARRRRSIASGSGRSPTARGSRCWSRWARTASSSASFPRAGRASTTSRS